MTTPTPNVETMAAGRALDALVAEKVMGMTALMESLVNGEVIALPAGVPRPRNGGTNAHVAVPRYSTDIAAAWQVVENLAPCCAYSVTRRPDWDYECCIWLHAEGPGQGTTWVVEAETAPLAICRAALAAVEAAA